jgi:acyl-coenzyme A synthetase/AMP-(fatty) acid ligase
VTPGTGLLEPDELRAQVASRLGAAHAPKEFVTCLELPRLPSGKVDRAAVRSMLRN